MKVIQTDNFNREGPGFDDILIAEGLSETQAKAIVKALRMMRRDKDYDPWFVAVEDNYKLQVFKP